MLRAERRRGNRKAARTRRWVSKAFEEAIKERRKVERECQENCKRAKRDGKREERDDSEKGIGIRDGKKNDSEV